MGREGQQRGSSSSALSVPLSAFPMKYVPIVFKSLSDKTLGVYFPQTGKNCSEGSEAKWGFQDSPNLINGRKCCLA